MERGQKEGEESVQRVQRYRAESPCWACCPRAGARSLRRTPSRAFQEKPAAWGGRYSRPNFLFSSEMRGVRFASLPCFA